MVVLEDNQHVATQLSDGVRLALIYKVVMLHTIKLDRTKSVKLTSFSMAAGTQTLT